MKKITVTIALAVLLAGCMHRQVTINPAPIKHRHAVHKVIARSAPSPVARPVVVTVPPPVVEVPPVLPPVVASAPPKHAALRWFLRDRSATGGK